MRILMLTLFFPLCIEASTGTIETSMEIQDGENGDIDSAEPTLEPDGIPAGNKEELEEGIYKHKDKNHFLIIGDTSLAPHSAPRPHDTSIPFYIRFDGADILQLRCKEDDKKCLGLTGDLTKEGSQYLYLSHDKQCKFTVGLKETALEIKNASDTISCWKEKKAEDIQGIFEAI